MSLSYGQDGEVQYDEKNIRRRVYDALNVLMAMEIIMKEKKQILWRGLPTNTQQEGTRMQMVSDDRPWPLYLCMHARACVYVCIYLYLYLYMYINI